MPAQRVNLRKFKSAARCSKKTSRRSKQLCTTLSKQTIASIDNVWYKNFVVRNPTRDLAQVKCGVLALFGDLDIQVPFESNSKSLVSALGESGNTNYKIKVFTGANHLFQKAKKGAISEYPTLEKKLISGFLEFTTKWLKEQVK